MPTNRRVAQYVICLHKESCQIAAKMLGKEVICNHFEPHLRDGHYRHTCTNETCSWMGRTVKCVKSR